MSPALPFDIIGLIIDIVGENKDTDLLKELALVSHSFFQICRKHLFATVDLRSANYYKLASSKKGFVKLLKSRPDVVKNIRKLTYRLEVSHYDDEDHLLSPTLLNLLPKFCRLNSLTIITASHCDWNTLDSSLTLAFLYIMHLPTINHIDLSLIRNFPLSSFAPSVNLLRLDIDYLCCFNRLDPLGDEDGSPEIVVESEIMPKIREFNTSNSALLTTKLLHAKKQDGRPAFIFTDLRRLSMSFNWLENEWNIRHLLQNAKLLEKLHLEVTDGRNLVGLLSLCARTLKVLELAVPLQDSPVILGGTCEELEALSGDNLLEALSFEVRVNELDTADNIGSTIQKVEQVLVKPGWSALKQVSFEVRIQPAGWNFGNSEKLCDALQSLPDTYISHLSKLESIAFNYSAYFIKS
jgi:hypothetical protein